MEMASESTPVFLTKSSTSLGLGVDRLGGHHVVLDAGQHAELAFDGDVVLVGVLDDLAGQLDVLLVGVVRAVDHHRGEAGVDARLAQLEGVAVVEVQGEGQLACPWP